ncbi:antimicrobial peptide system SdpA family protein [Streptomyces achromogenes]|uniref:SdpA family antimicrobial peptide system protein n=1 Tax=Streptomyces achromogenes TaxID=67255 RepID=UPI00278199BF|nr:SdpA family antimicrobial peptide system protein [Streptomyces achromogenes]MDQ0831410.1 antimicrobial peptide system SdpA family protein [Streptomyces achromogenes]
MKKELRKFCLAFTRTADAAVSVSMKSVIVVCAVWAVLIAYVVQEQLPKNVITLPGQTKARHTVANMAPQGWAFFTKSPRDAEIVPYEKRASGWKSASLTPHSSPHNAFGLDRRSRAQGVEIALLLSAAQKGDWHDCTSSRSQCLGGYGAPGRHIDNRSPRPTLCGTVGLLQEKPTPWAWRDLLPEAHSPERVMVLEVTC